MQKQIVARVTREFTKGILKGEIHRDTLTFVSVKRAEDWLAAIKANTTLNYVITDFYIENPAHV